ncbi:MFS transporter [Ornithinimicrobium faecis]|uniref:MFS transporter n=1 Tax=Ornithinimicrobium faecis TaxID=2934158 RepID=A0ABY4YSP8_9MICO|nr:MFS transporter [Ornithinimicrobium sp. HY1793]USQ79748.1 MFS transporter [Ornithinimicrobium sp. HY1793]
MARSHGRSATVSVMLGASALTTLGAIPPFLVGAQAVLMQRDLGFGPSVLGVVVSTFFAVAALGTIFGGGLLERWSRRQTQLLAGVLVAVGGFGLALGVRHWEVLIAAMAVLGLANAACQGTSNQAVATALPPHRRGIGFGIKQSAVPAAIMFGGLAVPTMTALFGWRSTFLVTGSLGLVVIALALLHQEEDGQQGPRANTRPAPSDHAPRGPLLLCGLAITFASAAANFLGAYLASWAHDVGLTVGQAGLLMAAGSGSSIAIRVFAGHRADRRFGGNLIIVASQMAAGALCLLMIGLLAVPWAVVVFGFLSFGLGWSWPGLFLYAAARLGRDAPTKASSVVQAGAFVGGAIGPVSFGLLVSAVSFQGAWFVAAGSFVVACALVLLARIGFRRDLVRRPPATPFGYGGGTHEPRHITGS